ncbi:MAG: FAD-dependent 5-carboxymethylaminomethyl-2-thiouridine(34) oxidoreductase MnmC [Micavibrio sp.]|nr:FAD-dependent 5-carboxymethylaminomethyl-2-thiouridine(34) oxidoreductase MnmC [Micavibrio sp.]
MRVAIIGGGLAGCALAYVLKRAGAEPVIYEADDSLACGASGNSLGLYNPRFSALRDAQSDFYTAAFSLAVRSFAEISEIEWRPCGALHLMNDEKKITRFPQTYQNWRWEEEHLRLVNADEASEIAGVGLDYPALYLPESGTVSPEKLCHAYTRGAEIHLNTHIEALEDIRADKVVLACGFAAKKFFPWLELRTVRGQLTEVRGTFATEKLKACLCYGGYMSPANEKGVHVVGATFQRWLDHSKTKTEDNDENIAKLSAVNENLARDLKVVGHRAGLRTTSRDHFPLIGALGGRDYISTGHGSHGILSSLMGAYLLADIILKRPRCLSMRTIKSLDPLRFVA